MANILLGDQNKELLWNILYSNKTFESIPQSKFSNVKTIFENAIIKVVNTNLEMLESTTNINTIKTLITQLNKVILQNIIADISNFSQLLLTATNVKTNYKTDTLESFEKQYKEKQVSFNEFMTKIEPPEVNFETIKENTLETSELDKLLENIQKERLRDIKEPIATNNNAINNNAINNNATNNNATNNKQDKLEVVDLNVFEKEILTDNVVQDQPSLTKKKIVTIDELLNNIQSIPEKKDSDSLLMTIDNKLTLLMANQQKILEKLGLL
jgi:predicted nucleotidyltransferase